MQKKIYQLITIFLLLTSPLLASNNVYIFATINDKIITNYDIEKEGEYLKMLNPNLTNLNEKKIFDIAKNSLINEIIKKNEIIKFFDLSAENKIADEYFQNLYKRLNFSNEKDFENSLINKKNYSLDQIKKKIKIEVAWNDLIFMKYKSQVQIDKNKLRNKIKKFNKETRKEYLLSEIVFEKKKDEKLEVLVNKIKSSISEIGFNNSANIYSVSESSNLGGKIGWISENNLSDIISKKLKKINEGEFTNVIQIGNNYLILKVEKIRSKQIEINEDEELEKMIKFETNKILNQFSRIFFSKAKINYSIDEK